MKKRDIETLLSTLLQRFEAHRYAIKMSLGTMCSSVLMGKRMR